MRHAIFMHMLGQNATSFGSKWAVWGWTPRQERGFDFPRELRLLRDAGARSREEMQALRRNGEEVRATACFFRVSKLEVDVENRREIDGNL